MKAPFKLPLKVVKCPCDNPHCQSYDLDDGTYPLRYGFTKNQAAYIVQAVNNYGEMVEALEAVRLQLLQTPKLNSDEYWNEVTNKIDALLAKVSK